MQQIVASVITGLAHAWSCETIVYRGSPVVAIADNLRIAEFPSRCRHAGQAVHPLRH
jgi:hypothetical protein